MNAWWDSLDTVLKILYCMTIPATLILVIQTILMLIGFGEGGADTADISDVSGLDMDVSDIPDDIDIDIDIDTEAFDAESLSDVSALRLFTLQTVIAFFTVFGWSSIVSLQAGGKLLLSLGIGIALGVLAMFLLAKLAQFSTKLAENGTQDIRNALGETATVYLPIPPRNVGHGKVTFTLQGTFTEYDAITLEEEALTVGTVVRIIDLRGDTLVVEKEK